VQKVKWGHVTWICKGSQLALSTYTSKIICAVLDVWRSRPYTIWNSLPAELTDNVNNLLLSGFKCSLKTYFCKFSFHKRCPHLGFISLIWQVVHHQLH